MTKFATDSPECTNFREHSDELDGSAAAPHSQHVAIRNQKRVINQGGICQFIPVSVE
jgi:hypothetical protein